jgi:hypothetical protein
MNENGFWIFFFPVVAIRSRRDDDVPTNAVDLEVPERNSRIIVERNLSTFELSDVKNPLTTARLPSATGAFNAVDAPSNHGISTKCASFYDLISETPELFDISCLIGFTIPSVLSSLSSGDNPITSDSSKNQTYRYWIIWLHLSMLLFTVVSVASFFYDLIVFNLEGFAVIFFFFTNTVGTVLQNFFLYPTVMYIRKSFLQPRDINIQEYASILPDTIRSTRRLIWWFNFLTLVFIICLCTTIATAPWLIIVYIFEGIFYLSSNYFLGGIYFFLVLEQRISYNKIYHLFSKLQQKQLSRIEYLSVFNEFKTRDRIQPISLFVSIAFFNTLLIIILISQLPGYETGLIDIILLIIFVISIFGRQLIILIYVLYEILKVNSLSDQMLKHLSVDYWGTITPGFADSSSIHTVSSLTLQPPKQENTESSSNVIDDGDKEDTPFCPDHRRTVLYVLLKENPIGSRIFSFRLSKFQLLAQICSLILSVSIVIIRTLVIANYS